MSEATFTFRVDSELKKEFSNAAKSRDRHGAQILRDFMRDFVRSQKEINEYDVWFRDQVKAGQEAAFSGEVISSEEAEKQAQAWRREIQSQLTSKK